MATSKKPSLFQTNYQKVAIDVSRSVCLYSVDTTASKSAGLDVHKELRKVPRATKTQLMDKFAREREIPHFIFDGDKKFYVPKRLASSDPFQVEIKLDENKPEQFTLRFSFVNEIALKSLNSGEPSSFEAFNVVNLAFRNHLTQNRYALVKKGLYDSQSVGSQLGDGLIYDFGFYQSVKQCEAGLMQVTDISACVFYKPNSLINYLNEAGRIRSDRAAFDEETWRRVNELLKGVNVVTTHDAANKKIYRILRISRESAKDYTFTKKVDGVETTVSVASHFEKEYARLKFPHLPCILVGNGRDPIAFPLEVCKIPPVQPYLKNLSPFLKAQLTQSTALKPDDRLGRIKKIIQGNHEAYDRAFMLSFGIQVPNKPNELVQVDEQILEGRSVIYQRGAEIRVANGQWRMGNKRLIWTATLQKWAIVYLYSNNDKRLEEEFEPKLVETLKKLGILARDNNKMPAVYSAEKKSVDDALKPLVNQGHQIVVFVLNDTDDYQQVKQLADQKYGILSQCVNYSKLTKQLGNPDNRKLATYCENLVMKMNAKLGGKNQSVEMNSNLDTIEINDQKEPVMFLGADVTHFGSGTGKKSIAAVVGSKDLGFLQYCCQLSEQENPDGNRESQELILDFEEMAMALIKIFMKNNLDRNTRKEIRPKRFIFFRDGVDSGQVDRLVSYEIEALRNACKRLQFAWEPKITLILVLKRHHSRLFPLANGTMNKSGNVPSGSYVDKVITSPHIKEFYLCSQDAMLGTAKAANYQIVLDENGLSLNDVINLSFDMCHLYVSSTKAVSLPAPLYYAHLAAYRGRLYEDDPEAVDSTENGSDTDGENRDHVLSRLIKVNKNLEDSMFFI